MKKKKNRTIVWASILVGSMITVGLIFTFVRSASHEVILNYDSIPSVGYVLNKGTLWHTSDRSRYSSSLKLKCLQKRYEYTNLTLDDMQKYIEALKNNDFSVINEETFGYDRNSSNPRLKYFQLKKPSEEEGMILIIDINSYKNIHIIKYLKMKEEYIDEYYQDVFWDE